MRGEERAAARRWTRGRGVARIAVRLANAFALLCLVGEPAPAAAVDELATFEVTRFVYRPKVKTLSPRATAKQLYRSKVLVKGFFVPVGGIGGVHLATDTVRISFGDFVQVLSPADFSATSSGMRRYKGGSLNGLRAVTLRPSNGAYAFTVLGNALRIAAPELFTLQVGNAAGQWEVVAGHRIQPPRSVLVGQVVGGDPPEGLRHVGIQTGCPSGTCRELAVDGRFHIEADPGLHDVVIDGSIAFDRPYARVVRSLDLPPGTTDIGIIALPALDLARASEITPGTLSTPLVVRSASLAAGGAELTAAAGVAVALSADLPSPQIISVSHTADNALPIPLPSSAWSPSVVAVQPEGVTFTPCADLRFGNPFTDLGDGSVVDVYAAGGGADQFTVVGSGTVEHGGTEINAPGVACETGWYFAACPAAVTDVVGRLVSGGDPIAGLPVYVDGATARTIEPRDLDGDGVADNFRVPGVAASCSGRPNTLRGLSRSNGPGFALAASIAGVSAVEDGASDAGDVELGLETCGAKIGEWIADVHNPVDVAVGSDGAIYVANALDHDVRVFDAAGRLVRELGRRGTGAGEFDYGPTTVAVDSQGNVYAVDNGSSSARIQKFDASGQFVRSTPVPNATVHLDLAVDAADNLYALDQSGPEPLVRVFSPQGTVVRTWGAAGSAPGQLWRPRGLAIAADGTILIADSGNHRVQRFDPSGVLLGAAGTAGTGPGEFTSMLGIAADPAGNIYLGDYQPGDFERDTDTYLRIQKLDAAFHYLGEWGGYEGASPGRFSGLEALATDGAGNVYTAEASRIQKLDPTGATTLEIGSFIWSLADFAVDPDGNLEAVDSNALTDRILTFAPDGTVLRRWGPTAEHFRDLVRRGLDVDAAGNVYVTDAGRCAIQKFDRGGTLLAEWGSEGSAPGQFDPPCDLEDVEADNRGHVYVYDRRRRIMNVFDEDGRYLTSWDGRDGSPEPVDGFHIMSSAGPASDGRGFLYVGEAAPGLRRIRKFDESGRVVASWSDATLGPGQFPSSQFHIAADAQGNVYAAEVRGPSGNAARVFIYDTLGNYIGQWTVPDDTDPGAPTFLYHIELDGRGHVFVNDSNGRMLEYNCPG